MTPRILLLQEDLATGGVATITRTLCQALREQDWTITVLALNLCGWYQRLTVARQCDVILASHNFRPTYVAWVLGLLLSKPVVVWVHGPLQEVLAEARTSSSKQGWLRWLYRRIPNFVFVSCASRDSFNRFMRRPLATHQHSVVIPNAVTLASSAAAIRVPDHAVAAGPQLAYIGRLSQEKRLSLLLDMLRLLPPQFQLTLVGDGPLRDLLRLNGTDLLVCGRLSLAGSQAHGPGLYSPWLLTLLASRYEGCPMTLLESFAAGVPCVSLPIPAVQEILGDDATYLLAHDQSAQALARAVQATLALPRCQVQADMARVLSRHQLKDFIQRWQDVLQNAARLC